MNSELNEREEYGYEDEEEYEESTEAAEDPNEETIRLELSQTPFEELLKLKDKLGTKLYNETIVSKIDKKFGKSAQRSDCFKRVNKNRPQEISSKKVVKQFREVFAIKKKSADNERRDPRFQEECGQYSQNVFNKTYSFLDDIKDKEINDLTKMLKKTKNEEKRQELSYLLQRMKNQKIAEQMKQNRKQIETNVRNKVKEEIGVKSSFVNKSTLKRLELVDKFKQLKKSGKLNKYMEKKRKKNAMRERRKMPTNKSNNN